MSTGPRDPDAVGRGVGVLDQDKAANHAFAPSAPTSARTIRPRFIENTLTVQGDGPAAAGDLIPSVSCPFVPVSGNSSTLLRLLEAPDGESKHRDAERQDDEDL